MAEIRWSEEAARWLQEIHEYISQDNPEVARKVIYEIYDKAQILKVFPKIGYKYRDEPDGEIRILLYGHYRIAYIIKNDVVEILGIFHGSLEIDKYIKA